MSFVPETGAGLSTATSYVSLATANTYHTAHGNPATWTAASNASRESALMQATRWLDAHLTWRGIISVEDQALGWPRTDVYDDEGRGIASDIVPDLVREACCLLALYHLSSPLDASLSRGGQIRRQKVGSVEVEYDNYAPGASSYSFVDWLVRGLVASSAAAVILERA